MHFVFSAPPMAKGLRRCLGEMDARLESSCIFARSFYFLQIILRNADRDRQEDCSEVDVAAVYSWLARYWD